MITYLLLMWIGIELQAPAIYWVGVWTGFVVSLIRFIVGIYNLGKKDGLS